MREKWKATEFLFDLCKGEAAASYLCGARLGQIWGGRGTEQSLHVGLCYRHRSLLSYGLGDLRAC